MDWKGSQNNGPGWIGKDLRTERQNLSYLGNRSEPFSGTRNPRFTETVLRQYRGSRGWCNLDHLCRERERERIRWSIFGFMDYFTFYPIGSMYAIYGNIHHQYIPNVSIYIYHTWILWDMLGMGRKWRKRKVWAEAWRLAGVGGLHSHECRSLPDASRAPRFPGDVCDELFTDTYCDNSDITWFMWLDFNTKIQMTEHSDLYDLSSGKWR